MAQQVTLPDYKDRSLNHPSVLVSIDDYLDLYYQQNHGAQTMSTSDEDELRMKQWFMKAAVMSGWPAVGFMGRDALLSIVPLPTWVDESIDRDLQVLDSRMVEPLPDSPASASAAIEPPADTLTPDLDKTKEVVTVNAEEAQAVETTAQPVDTTKVGKTSSTGSNSRLHVSVAEVAAYGDTKQTNDYKRG